jgi:hypothetical protein
MVSAAVGDRTVVHVEAEGFAEAFPVARVTTGQATPLGVRLLATGVTSAMTVSSGGTVTVPNSTGQVTLPANGLVPKNGSIIAGTVNVAVTPINPAVDPRLMPGDYTGVSAGGITPIESFGALLVDIRDNSGTRYNLAEGKTATIRIPLGTLSPNPPATIPLFFFDETTGLWQEEGTATLQGMASNRYYEGTVSHFSYWNADQGWTPIFVSGCVRDSNNQPVANLMVQAIGRNYSGSDIDFTAGDGTFRVAVRQGSQATLSAVDFSLQTFTFTTVTNVVTVGPSTIDFTLSNCLVKRPAPLTITTVVLSEGNIGLAYNQTLAAAGGIPGYVWSLNPGSNPLPVGLSLNPSGVISGTPTTAGSTTITVRVTDLAGETATHELSLTVTRIGALRITSLSPLPAGIVGTAYNMTLVAVDGVPALLWSVVSGALPAGVTLNPSTGQLSGTPTREETSIFTIRVQDSGVPQQSEQKQFSLTTNTVPPDGVRGILTVVNAPASVGGTFEADKNPQFSGVTVAGTVVAIASWEFSTNHDELLTASYDSANGTEVVIFATGEAGGGGAGWSCTTNPLVNTTCSGFAIDRAAGTATFTNTVLTPSSGATQSITLNGTLTFRPF